MNYEINKNTLAIIPSERKGSNIIENESTLYNSFKVRDIINYNCLYYGSTLEGRIKGTFNLIGVNKKSPIIIEETNAVIFFPTSSPSKIECSWISLNNVISFKEGLNKSTIIEFINGNKIELPISIYSFSKQYLRACRLKSIILSRKMI